MTARHRSPPSTSAAMLSLEQLSVLSQSSQSPPHRCTVVALPPPPPRARRSSARTTLAHRLGARRRSARARAGLVRTRHDSPPGLSLSPSHSRVVFVARRRARCLLSVLTRRLRPVALRMPGRGTVRARARSPNWDPQCWAPRSAGSPSCATTTTHEKGGQPGRSHCSRGVAEWELADEVRAAELARSAAAQDERASGKCCARGVSRGTDPWHRAGDRAKVLMARAPRPLRGI